MAYRLVLQTLVVVLLSLAAVPSVAFGQADRGFSQEWCDKCKSAERDGCKKPCAPEQGVKYFVCLDDCFTKRCEMACTPVEEDPAEKQKRIEKNRKVLCNTCRRQSNKLCRNECSHRNGRERARCKKKCIVERCTDACSEAPAATTVDSSKPQGSTIPAPVNSPEVQQDATPSDDQGPTEEQQLFGP